ncbi:phosphate acetyltransferase [Bifidobacterium platyrrhinorum]|uniref:Phosphate acetyltransferase n=1 Tax=Bifidobacterium platyrrhinorum TaxID=2661628 RepID=A0A6L9SYK6_9BIFI|nr:phosphate acetyltransferase [Bifidobacterium platyrrhinorum]NEG56221.1 phosphate acetyltransferase [Bifidobacterium platyrrhinorum]
MTVTRVYIASPEGANGRNVVAYGVLNALTSKYKTMVFRPAVSNHDHFTPVLLSASNAGLGVPLSTGLDIHKVRADKETARGDIVGAFNDALSVSRAEAALIVGTDRSHVNDPTTYEFNANVAADLQAGVFLSICTIDRWPDELDETVKLSIEGMEAAGNKVLGIFVTGCEPRHAFSVKQTLAKYGLPVWTIPQVPFTDESNKTLALETFRASAPTEEVLAALDADVDFPITPYAFQYGLIGKAKTNKKTIVLPEGEEDRIIKAADFLLEREAVNLIIVGDKESILARGKELGLQYLDRARFQSMDDEEILRPMVDKLCELRAKKGMTEEQARKQLKDASYFGTMLVVLGQADGLVSGSVNSTANTVRPALQVIKTKPGQKLVSGAFLMCFKDHVAVFADCAINLNPTAEQLAEIAIQSAATAKSFGIDPKVGMLSYSTLGSGKGPDVDVVEEATRLVREKAPDLPVVGSIQFDAAWSPTVAATKAKGNDVAGHVNVFVFPDLCAGNIGYKAVQRSSGALAIGPVLQGLNKPVNDLSRGALVQDIINTVALTAVTAQ